eukprot:TRINITY_DN12498_c0_g1_i1.p1 TRINITY_DN12498_c0_g1~~TRINITY_DN12498_c0_g1_i1.p1  ORF type:complete len:462 (-),score=87.69 TRINITY_DN12498_c0_g1_i1:131-1516(-)
MRNWKLSKLSPVFGRAFGRQGAFSCPSQNACIHANRSEELSERVLQIRSDEKGPRMVVELHSWGRGTEGQLGRGTEEIIERPRRVMSMSVPSNFQLAPMQGLVTERLRNSSFVLGSNSLVELGISCGLFHSALLADGRVYLWGKGDGGRLGFGNENSLYEPSLNTYLENVQNIALGGLHSVALTKDGEAFSWGYGGFGALGHTTYHRERIPKKIICPWAGRLTYIATSGAHTAAVCNSGEVYTWGRDEGEGRLGLGSGRAPDDGASGTPLKVDALPVPAIATSCGGFFTLALTRDGKVWSWGGNENSELGRDATLHSWIPNPVTSLDGVNIVQIACGGFHSLALSDDGKVFTWGHGGQGQLGHGSTHNVKVPQIVKALANEHVVYIACGSLCSAAITDAGKLYMWGSSVHSLLGIPGLPDIQPLPIMVNFVDEDDEFGPPHVHAVAAGAAHGMSLLSRTLK